MLMTYSKNSIHRWPAAGLRAVTYSFAAVVVTVMVVGAAYVALGIGRLRDVTQTSITHCALGDDPNGAVLRSWTLSADRPAWDSRLWFFSPIQARAPRRMIWPHAEPNCVVWAAGSERIYVGCGDGTVYSAKPGRPDGAPQFVGRHAGEGVEALAVSGDGRHLVSRSPDLLRVWNLADGGLFWEREARDVNCLAIHPTSQSVVCGLIDGRIVEHDVASGVIVRTLAGDRTAAAVDLTFSSNGRLLAAVVAAPAFNQATVRLLEWPSGRESWPANMPACYAGWARRAIFSPCSSYLVVTAPDRGSELEVWSVREGRRLTILRGHTGTVLGAAFAADGRLLSWGTDGMVHIWDASYQRPTRILSLMVGRG
jgi:WD40 repeat protein